MSMTTPPVAGITIQVPVTQTTLGHARDATAQPPESEAKGVQVELSAEGRAAAASSSRDADIEQSGLPEGIQKILKAIRELQRRIEELMEQIQQVLNDPGLGEEERRTKMMGLQTQTGQLQQQISSSNSDLNVLMSRLKFNEDRKSQVKSLMMAKS